MPAVLTVARILAATPDPQTQLKDLLLPSVLFSLLTVEREKGIFILHNEDQSVSSVSPVSVFVVPAPQPVEE